VTHKPHFSRLIRALTYNGVEITCDKCKNITENYVLLMRGGYVQEQLCLDCDKKKREGEKDE